MRFTLIKLTLTLILIAGCAHEKKFNSAGCKSYFSRNPVEGSYYFLAGILFQQGECSLIRPLRIELGGIYDAHKNSLMFALDTGGGSEIDTFASDIGCHNDSYDLFKKELIKNKIKIFGEKHEKSSRQVMLGVYQMIKSNEELYKLCWR